jgi:UDP-N-acetylglucosamine/UDP-N-acetyl-alpha-D-glucosaminouronate 4-epimerase
MKTCLVTGGAGFIGSHIASALVERGCKVRVLDNLSTGKRENMAGFIDKIEFIEGSITDMDVTQAACKGMEVVFHQAALASVPRSVDDPVASNDHNINGTLNMLVAARDNKVSRFVYAASSSCYGDSPTLPKLEDMPCKPMSPYAVNKYVGELYLEVFAEIYGLSTIGLRYFNVFGPRQDPQSTYAAVIPIFITSLLKGKAATINGDGSYSRDFTYIDNVVHANMCAAEAEDPVRRVMNVACGDRISLNDLYEGIQAETGADIAAIHAPARTGDVPHSQADISLARQMIGYEPQVDFQTGLKATINWYKDNLS